MQKILLVIVFGLFCSSISGLILDVDFNSLPSDQGWRFSSQVWGESTIFSNSQNRLEMNTMGGGVGGSGKVLGSYTYDNCVTGVFTYKIRANILQYENMSWMPYEYNGVYMAAQLADQYVALGMRPDGMTYWHDGTYTTLNMNLGTNQFHEYYVRAENGKYDLYVDNTKVLDQINFAQGYSGNYIVFGDGTNTANSQVLYDKIEFTQTGGIPSLTAGDKSFGNIRVGSSISKDVTVTNNGDYGSYMTGRIGAAPGRSDFTPNSGSTSFALYSGEQQNRTFTFNPSSTGYKETQVTIVNNNGSNETVTLSGTGVTPVFNSSVASGTTIDFGFVKGYENSSRTISLQNLTDGVGGPNLTDLTILSANITGEDADQFSLVGFTPGTRISKDEIFQLLIKFAHDGTLGIKNAVLTLVTDQNAALGQAGDSFTYYLQGAAVPEPASVLSLSMAIFATFFFFRKNK